MHCILAIFEIVLALLPKSLCVCFLSDQFDPVAWPVL